MRIIQVTEDDIKKGQRGSPFNCPIALAVKRELPESRVIVDDFLQIDEDRYWLTDNMMDFIDGFDNERFVKPFIFDLDDLMLLGD